MNARTSIKLGIVIFLGVIMCLFSEADKPFGIWITMLIFSIAVVFGLQVKISKFSFLTRTMVVFYALPFAHCFEYIVNPSVIYGSGICGVPANPYNTDPGIVARMAMNGCIGMLGLVAGYLFLRTLSERETAQNIKITYAPLGIGPFLLIGGTSVLLAYLNAPAETIFGTAYTNSFRILTLSNVEFNAAGLLSNCCTAFLFIDALNEKRPVTLRFKVAILLPVLFLNIVWFDIMRGVRRCLGLILAMGVMYFTRLDEYGIKQIPKVLIDVYLTSFMKWKRRTFIKISILFILVFLIFQVVGTIRNVTIRGFIQGERSEKISYLSGTWSFVLLTPLSVVGDFYNGLMTPKFGSTYREYLLSIPPGIIAQKLGYERPITETNNPAYEMRYGLGGTHVMVVPYMNFKSFGVFFILLLYGMLIGWVEKGIETGKLKRRFLYACFLIVAPFWFWYSDLDLIRGVMAFFIVWWTYRIFTRGKRCVVYQDAARGVL